jgi:hypothetical protein
MLAGLATLLLALVTAPAALADTASIAFTDAAGNSDPAANVGRTLTLTGNTTVSKHVWIKFRAAGGAPCAPSSSSDSGDNTFDGFDGDQFNGTAVNGNFTLKKTGVWPTAGAYTFCIWLADQDTTSVTPITQNVVFRNPTGTISATVAPLSPLTGEAATVTITGSSEGPERVFATIRLAGGAPCASSYSADSGGGLVDGTSVNGSYTVTATTSQSTPGTYMVCLWLADSSTSGAPIAGPQPVTFTVLAPCLVPDLSPGTSIGSVTASLTAAHCTLKRHNQASSRYHRNTLVRFSPAAGTRLAPNAPVSVTISTGRPCVVPAVHRGTRLSTAKSRLKHAGCTVGKVKRVHSSRRSGTVVRYGEKRGRRLKSRARVGILVAR